MTARIEQLEQRLASMASARPGLGAGASTSYGTGEDFTYMASVAQVDALVAVTRGAARTSESRGSSVELDPQRGEASKQTWLSQSFLLSEALRTPLMAPIQPGVPVVGSEPSTLSVVDTDTASSAVLQITTSVLELRLFLATELMASKVKLALVFWLAATLCKRGQVTATSAKV